jgi:hypothetical protein
MGAIIIPPAVERRSMSSRLLEALIHDRKFIVTASCYLSGGKHIEVNLDNNRIWTMTVYSKDSIESVYRGLPEDIYTKLKAMDRLPDYYYDD